MDCSSFSTSQITPENERDISYIQMVETHKVCRGKGKLFSRGDISGELTFYYSCSKDKVHIHFKDMLGRKTMIMIVKENSVVAWDMINNIQFSSESIYLRFPFFEFVKPQDFLSIFWGFEPEYNFDKNTEDKPSTTINFISDKLTLDSVQIEMKSDNQLITIIFDERDYGSSYPQLIKPIPNAIPKAQS